MFTHRPKIAKYLFGVFVIVVLIYAFFEARNLLYGPQINLGTTGAITVHAELVEISGTVKNVSEITLDGRPVLIDDTGAFTERLLLARGLNRFDFRAKDRFGRSRKEVLEIVFIPESETGDTPQTPHATSTHETTN